MVVCEVAELAVRMGMEVEIEEYREEKLEKVEEEATHLRMLDLTPRTSERFHCTTQKRTAEKERR